MTTITWKTDVSGDWSLGTNWLGSIVPTSANQVLISATGAPYTVTISVPEAISALALNSSFATLQVDSVLTLGGALTLTAGTVNLVDTIKGGTLVLGTGGTFDPNGGGTLDGVKVQGSLLLTQNSAPTLVVKDGLSLTNLAGTGAGSVSLTGSNASLTFASGVQTLTSAVAGQGLTVSIGSASGDTINQLNAGGTITTTTIAAPVALVQVGKFATLTASSQSGDSMVNAGFVKAAVNGGTLLINGGSFVNSGGILDNFGDTVSVLSSNFRNTGSIVVENAATLNLGQGGTWSSTGTITDIDATVNLLGTVTPTEVQAITSRAGGLVDLAGSLALGGGTLSVGTGTTLQDVLLTGTIANGVIKDAGLGMQFGTNSFPNPTLSGVAYDGVLDLSEPGARLTVLGAFAVSGPTGTGPGTINLTGASANLTLTGSRTLDNAVLRIGGASFDIANPGTTTAVTFGPHLTIFQGGVSSGFFGGISSNITGSFNPADSLLNQGTIEGSLQNGGFTIQGFGTFTNAGAIAFSNGDNLSINSGTVTNQTTMAIGNGVSVSLSGQTAFNNPGLITAGFGSTVAITGQTLTDAGTMSIASGSTLTIENFSSFANQGTVNLAANSTMEIGSPLAAWTSTGKINATGATVDLLGIVTQAQIAAITRTGGVGVIDIAGMLNDTAAPTTLNVGTGSAFGALQLTGTINGGIIHDAGGGLTFPGPQFGSGSAQLDALTYEGTVDLSEANAKVDVVGGIVLTGTAGTGAGAVNLTGSGSFMLFTGSTVVDNATINVGSGGFTFDGGATLGTDLSGFTSGATLLTLGSKLVVKQAGQIAFLQGPTDNTDMLINRGSIAAGLSGGTFTISGNQFENLGAVTVSNGDFLDITSSSFINPGTVSVLTGATLEVGANGDWTSTGKLIETGATVLLEGDVTLPEISSITRSGGALVVAGRYNNFASTLNIGAGSTLGDFVLAGNVGATDSGVIDNGTIHDAGGGLQFQSATLDTVKYEGVVDLSETSASLTVLASLTATNLAGTAAGQINLTGAAAELTLQQPQTLDNATVDIGNASGATLRIAEPFFGGTSWTTTLGSKLVIQQTGADAMLAGSTGTTDMLVNNGSIGAGFAAGTFTISGNSFANAGVISVSNGDVLTVDPTSFTNTGTVTVTTGGVLNLGTLVSFFGESATTFTSTGKLSETGGSIILSGAVTLANLNSITRSGGTLMLAGTADLGGGTLNVGGTSALGALVVTGTIQNGVIHDADPGLLFTGSSQFAPTPGTLFDVTDDGTLDLSQAGAAVNLLGTVTFAGLTGAGRASIFLTGAGATMMTQGTFELNSATMNLGGAEIEAVSASTGAAQLTLGPALTINHTTSTGGSVGTATITSTNGFSFEGGGPGSVINDGLINAKLAGGTLAVGGQSFTNQGGIAIASGDSVSVTAINFTNTHSGVITVNAATLTIGSPNSSASFTNNGSVTVTGGGTLNLGTGGGGGGLTWTSGNPGLLSETASTLNLNGPVTLANLNSITRSGGTITINNTADLGGGVLNVGGTTALGALVLAGTMQNGTINDADPGMIFGGFGATLRNIIYHGTMDLSEAGSTVTEIGGLVMTGLGGTGAGKILLTGSGSAINAAGTQTIGNALLDIGGGASLLSAAGAGGVGAPQLTLASNLMVVHAGGNATIGGAASIGTNAAAIVNMGSISAIAAGGLFTLGGGSFTNKGVIAVGSSDTMSIIAPMFTNNGALSVATGGVLNLGLVFGSSMWSSTTNINVNAATLNLFSNVTIANLGKITRTGGTINFQGTLNGAGGTLNLGVGFAVGTLQDTGTISNTIIHDGGNGLFFFGPQNSSVHAGAVLSGDTYQGTMNVTQTLANLTIVNGITSTGVSGTGTGLVNLTGGGAVLYAQGTETFNAMTINIGNAAPLGSSLFQTDPTALGAVLTLGTAMVINQSGMNANILGARNQGDMIVNNGRIFANFVGGQFLITQGSFTNNGSIVVGTGDTMTISTDTTFTNTKILQLNGGTVITPLITDAVGGTIIGRGTVNAPVNGGGAIEAQAGTLIFDAAINKNTAQIDAGSILQVNGAINGGSVTFATTASGILALAAANAASTTVIDGFAGSDEIDLLNTAVTSTSYSGSATSGVLTVKNGTTVVATLSFNGDFTTPSFGHTFDGGAGTFITFVPGGGSGGGGGGGGGGGSGIVVPAAASMIAAPSMQFIAPQATVTAAANETLLLPAAGAAAETVTGFTFGSSEVLDLRYAMLGSAWNGDASTMGDFVSTSQSGGNTLINVAPTGHGAGSTIGVIAGLDTSLSELTAHHAISYS